jgi:anti-anti-sigma factor
LGAPHAGSYREVVIKFDIRSVGIFDVVSARLADGEVFDSAKLKNTVRFLIENDMRNVVIDLGNLEYLYSDTINAFIASNRHMLEVSGRIAILTEHPKVQDILKRAGLDNIMRIYRSEAEMIADSKEILRQTSSYRIEELQKISSQPAEVPSTPKTEFDEFKAEMGQRLGNKLDNNELPQYQLGVAQNAPAAPTYQAPAAPSETAYPSFNPPGFTGQQMGEAPPPGFPQNQPAPAYNYNNGPAWAMRPKASRPRRRPRVSVSLRRISTSRRCNCR